MSAKRLNIIALCVVAIAAALLGVGNGDHDKSPKLLNVSCYPTRELCPAFINSNVAIFTPDPNMAGNSQLSFLAAWRSVVSRGFHLIHPVKAL